MKRCLPLLVGFVLFIANVYAQSLGEIAAKEKERRKKNAEQGVKVKELKVNGEPTPASAEPAGDNGQATDPSAADSDSKTVSPSSGAGTEQAAKKSSKSSQVLRTDEDKWATTFSEYQKQYDQTRKSYEKKLAEMRHMLTFCHNRMGGPQQGIPVATVLGQDVPVGDCTTLPDDIKRTEKAMDEELRGIEDRCMEEARRKGILPGRARLR